MRFDPIEESPDLFHAMFDADRRVSDAAAGAVGSEALLQLLLLRTSYLNGCEFCLHYHMRLALDAGEKDGRVVDVSEGRLPADMAHSEALLFELAELVTRRAAQEDMQAHFQRFLKVGTRSQWVLAAWAVAVCNMWNCLLLASGNAYPAPT
ncbi:MAG TPA: carboxymuconolactone decarboxylase family protein [Luteimonas sp.]|nr:carboxymuconolactone decarboxylase family protein [Luteimonas sp.]